MVRAGLGPREDFSGAEAFSELDGPMKAIRVQSAESLPRPANCRAGTRRRPGPRGFLVSDRRTPCTTVHAGP